MNTKQLRRGKHGEVLFLETEKLPQDAKQIKINENFYVVGESETHGNDHRVAVLDKQAVQIFKDGQNTWIKNSKEVEVYCPNKTRHDSVKLPVGTWKVHKSMEYDYEDKELKAVRD